MKRWLTFHDAAAEVHRKNPDISKDDFARSLSEVFALQLDRKLYFADDFAVRFCYSSKPSFSGTVIGLRVIQKYDALPFLVCLLRPTGVETFLVNSTFISKASHSSHSLTYGHIRGSINGTGIMRHIDGVPNTPAHFEELFETHASFDWDENWQRIVAATSGIIPSGSMFVPTADQTTLILKAVVRSIEAETSGQLRKIETTLNATVAERTALILNLSRGGNPKQRGDAIEQLLTGEKNLHRIEDQLFEIEGQVRVLVDVKTKMLDLNSSPKLYNIDKMLRTLSDGRFILCLYLIGVDRKRGSVRGRLVDVLDSELIARTCIQFHWAGRNSRGVTQLNNDTKVFLEPGFQRNVELSKATDFLNRLLSET